MFGFERSQKHDKYQVQGHLIVVYTYHIFGTKIGRSRKASNTQHREIHDNSSDIQMVFSHASKDQRDEANQTPTRQCT